MTAIIQLILADVTLKYSQQQNIYHTQQTWEIIQIMLEIIIA